jgi:HD superfamily phosphodiesterase
MSFLVLQRGFLVVENFAKRLYKLYPQADKKAVMLAVWFYDIGRAHGKDKNHDIYGAKYAKKNFNG